MTVSQKQATTTGLLAKATAELKGAGYKVVAGKGEPWGSANSRLFEDACNIVGVVVFETCGELLESWPDQQESLVSVISKDIGAGEAKAGDGYLVLLTPGTAPSERERLRDVRYDMSRVRKLIATGDELDKDADVARVLRPLLPLVSAAERPAGESSLNILPKLLLEHEIPEPITEALVDAFMNDQPLMERLHIARGRK